MTEETWPELTGRHQLFEAARRSADWTIEQLWIDYLAVGGTLLVFDLDAYLAGLMPLPPGQQDVLACALNERLTDLHHPTRLAYLTVLPDRCADASNALAEVRVGLPRHDGPGLVPSPAFQQPPEEQAGPILGREGRPS
jgi:hypothetical protein